MSSFTTDTLPARPAPSARQFAPLRAIRRAVRTPKGLMTLVLLGLLALATAHAGVGLVAPGVLAAVGIAAALDFALIWLTRGKPEWPSGAALTALFIALILDPNTPAYVIACTAVLAVNSKYLLRTRWANIFNPAAIALVAYYYLFGSGQSWWGALPDLPAPFVLALLAGVVFIAQRIKKLPLVLAFLGAYFALFTVATFLRDPAQVAEIFRAPDANAALFFAGFMLTDPPTSPARPRDQVAYALLVAGASVGLYFAFGVLWFLPGALLVGNLIEATRRVLAGRRRKSSARPAARVAANTMAAG
jgi:Na+-translocating ferredoxin:NAD+ oxidoreductase RnfD subunit